MRLISALGHWRECIKKELYVCVGTSEGQVVESDAKGTERRRMEERREGWRGWSEREEGKMRWGEL